MKDSDRNFLKRLIERLKQIKTLLVVDEPEDKLRDVVRIITELNPTRDVRPIMTNLKDLEPSLLSNVRAEGKVLFATPDAILPPPKSDAIMKYDLTGIEQSKRSRVSMVGVYPIKEYEGWQEKILLSWCWRGYSARRCKGKPEGSRSFERDPTKG